MYCRKCQDRIVTCVRFARTYRRIARRPALALAYSFDLQEASRQAMQDARVIKAYCNAPIKLFGRG